MTTNPASEVATRPESIDPGERQRSRRPALLLGLALVTGVLGLGIYSGVRTRNAADATLKRTTAVAAVPIVSVISPTASASTREILLPGTTQAFTDAPIFARTNGYVKRWYFDIGAHVKAGQLLAEIETPEVDQQLQQARADLETARANLRQAQITADRWRALLESASVSKAGSNSSRRSRRSLRRSMESSRLATSTSASWSTPDRRVPRAGSSST